MASDSHCEFCGEVEMVSHVLRGCLEALAIWVRLVKRGELDEFLSMELQQWFVFNLFDASHFSNAVTDWDTGLQLYVGVFGVVE
ncbi:hypothetical protein J1N35_022815 [Gossypium stocksii]|uniref:Reverse transcriptase zinc-binding domain-containing protein n=1 Tax=Gossypium stocksii TaxID=47602 RepID=A0A9D3VIL2_9ROSI|nr:hypothetical protein J1N35_022815 [Gossypium stocksii]